MARAARALGFRPERVRVIPVDRAFHLRVDALERARGGRPGRRPAPARGLRQRRHDEHRRRRPAARPGRPVPPTHGLLAARGRRLRRLRRADGARARGAGGASSAPTPSRSIRTSGSSSRSSAARCSCATPTACGSPSRSSRTTCATSRARTEVNFSDRGLQLSRMCRALKVWMSIQTFGLAAFRAAVDQALDLAARGGGPRRGERRARAAGARSSSASWRCGGARPA